MKQHRRHALAMKIPMPVIGRLVGREPVTSVVPGSLDKTARRIRHGRRLAPGLRMRRPLVDEKVGLARRDAALERDGMRHRDGLEAMQQGEGLERSLADDPAPLLALGLADEQQQPARRPRHADEGGAPRRRRPVREPVHGLLVDPLGADRVDHRHQADEVGVLAHAPVEPRARRGPRPLRLEPRRLHRSPDALLGPHLGVHARRERLVRAPVQLGDVEAPVALPEVAAGLRGRELRRARERAVHVAREPQVHLELPDVGEAREPVREDLQRLVHLVLCAVLVDGRVPGLCVSKHKLAFNFPSYLVEGSITEREM